MKKRKNKGKKKIIAIVIAIVVVLTIGIGAYLYWYNSSEPKTTQIYAKIESCSELVTAKATTYDFLDWESDGIKYITQKKCTLFCCATIEARYDLSKCEIDEDETSVIIKLPSTATHKVILDEIKYLEQKNGIFADRDLDDSESAKKYAENELTSKYNYEELDNMAKEQLEKTLSTMLAETVKEKEIKYEYVL